MMSFKKFFYLLESTEKTFKIPFILGDEYTMGRHAFNEGEKEIPAKDPSSLIEPEIIYPQDKLVDILNLYGSQIINVIYARYEWGSYHERQLYCQAHLEIAYPDDTGDNYELERDLDDIKGDDYFFPIAEDDSRSDIITLPFTSFEDIVEKWWEFAKKSEITSPTGSSEDYWNKKILTATMGSKKIYDGD